MGMSKAEAGRLGGKATVAKHGTEHMSTIGKRGFDMLVERLGDYGAAVSYLQSYRDMPKLAHKDWGAYLARRNAV
jgi:hypothetical protein